ncbi:MULTISPECIES: P8 family protein [Lapidilactobacillus]|jgi:hypothetical protein|uniref:Uncharacterized protein n=1 Tax=Lapidilactobacillus gannanensis TaxID=2486002 RepID=A0ABW4BJR7_9LACO|nr:MULTISPECIES: hypothetical protein [Lapidilactobacillus]
MAENIETEPEVLNLPMADVFEWSDDKTVVRDAIWDFIMESNGRDTIKTEETMKPFLDMTEAQVKDYVEKNLKK